MNVKVKVYDRCKYHEGSKKVADARYEIEYFEVLNGDQVDIGSFGNDEDDFDEYLVLHLVGGETATFRNSYVDLFKEGVDIAFKTTDFEVWKDDEMGHEYKVKGGFTNARDAIEWIEEHESLYPGWHLSWR